MSYKSSIFLNADENASIWKLVKKRVESCTIAFVKKFEIKKGNQFDSVTLCFVKTLNTGLYYIYLYNKDKKLVWTQDVSATLKMKLKPNLISLKNEDEEFFRIHFLCDDETKSIFAEINQVLIQLKKHEKNKKRWKKLSVLQKSVKKFHYWESCGLNSAEFIILEKWNIPTQILMKKAVRQNIVDFFKNNDVKKIMELTQQNHQVKEVVKSENDSTSNKSDEECPKIDGVLLRRPTRKAPVPPKSCPTIAVVEPEKFSSMPPPPPPLPILSFPRSSQDTLDLHDGIKCKQLRRASCPENKPTDIHSQLMDAVRCFNKNKLESVPKDLNENRDLDPRDELLMNIKNFNLRSLKPVLPGNSGAGTPETETDSQDKLLNEILNFDRKKLKPFKNNEETPTAKFRKFDSGIFSDELMTKLKGRREDIDSSDSESDGESSDFDDEWED